MISENGKNLNSVATDYHGQVMGNSVQPCFLEKLTSWKQYTHDLNYMKLGNVFQEITKGGYYKDIMEKRDEDFKAFTNATYELICTWYNLSVGKKSEYNHDNT